MSGRTFTMLIITDLFHKIFKKKFGNYKKQANLVKDFHYTILQFLLTTKISLAHTLETYLNSPLKTIL